MSGPRIDPELLAATIEGTASESERESVLRRVGSSKQAYAEFAEASAITREFDAAPLVSTERPTGEDPVPRVTANKVRYIAAFALLAATLAIFVVSRRFRDRESDFLRVAQATKISGAGDSGSIAASLGVGWSEPPWSTRRGADGPSDAAHRAFRTGVRSAQLQVALTAEDSSAVANAVAQLRDLVSGVAGAAALNLRLAALAKSPRTADVGTRFAISTQSRALIGDSEWFNLGVWTAVADIAAANGQAEFFAQSGAAMVELSRLLAANPPTRSRWIRATSPLRGLPFNGAATGAELNAVRSRLAGVFAEAGG